jgi:catechol 2,3-dioxygenase-like lactoylglutathione lyase family enzyme
MLYRLRLGLERMTLQHVSLEVRRGDVPACTAFWELLGFHPVDPPGAIGGIASWVQREGTQIHLLWTDEPVAAPRGHAAVVVDDFDAALQALRDAGFEPREAAREWGAGRAFVRDPAGHRVEVMERPPVVS